MKIYYVLPDFKIVGAQRLAIDFGNKLIEKGHNVFWISGAPGKLIKDVDSRRVIFYTPKLQNIPKIRLIESLLRLFLIIRKIDDAVLISVTPFLNRYLCFLKLIGLTKFKLIIEDHAIPQFSNKEEFSSKFTRFFYESTVWLYNQCDKLRVTSQECEKYYKKKLHTRTKIINYPNLINLKRILYLSKKKNNLHPKKKKRIVYIGRLTTQKNIDFIIKSFSKISNKDFELFIIGDGPLKNNLKSLVSNLNLTKKIFFLKSSNNNYSILKTADLFPIASLWEGMPITICEAMILSVPVVSTDFLAGPRFYLGKNSQRGWIVPQNNILFFSNKIKHILFSLKKKNKTILKAKSFILKKMDIDTNIDNFIKIFLNFK